MSAARVIVDISYLISALLFVAGLKGLGKVKSALRGRGLLIIAMLIAVVATALEVGAGDYGLTVGALVVGAGLGAAIGFGMNTRTLAGVALTTALAGGAAALYGFAWSWQAAHAADQSVTLVRALAGDSLSGYFSAPGLVLALVSVSAAFTGGLVCVGKAGGSSGGAAVPARAALWFVVLAASIVLVLITAYEVDSADSLLVHLVLALGVGGFAGVLFALPMGNRDVPAAIAVLLGFAGLAAAGLGFMVFNNALIIVGGIVLATALTFAGVLAQGMSRSLGSLFVGGTGGAGVDSGKLKYSHVRSCGIPEAAMVLEDAHSVVIVPGFGYAVAQAQNAARELAQLLEKRGVKVRYAVHPMAGRMPGHMNLLLSEADVPYALLNEPEQINDDLKSTDVVIVLGANDIVNPDAESNRESAVYGMPMLRVGDARTVFVVKRSLRPGYTGAKNPLFEAENTMLLYGDAKKVLQSIGTELKTAGSAHG